MMSQFIQKINL